MYALHRKFRYLALVLPNQLPTIKRYTLLLYTKSRLQLLIFFHVFLRRLSCSLIHISHFILPSVALREDFAIVSVANEFISTTAMLFRVRRKILIGIQTLKLKFADKFSK